MNKKILFFLALFLSAMLPLRAQTEIGGLYYNLNDENHTATVAYPGSTSVLSGAITIPSTITYGETEYNVTTIADDAFNLCTGITSIAIPASVIIIEEGPFFGANDLTTITVDPANPNFSSEDGVLYDKNKYTILCFPNANPITNYYVPASVTSYDEYAFDQCVNLSTFTVDENNSQFSAIDGVLLNKAQTKILMYPDGNSRTSYTIPDGVTEIVDYVFYDNSTLTSIILPNSINTIGEGAFMSCTGLATVNIPMAVTFIGKYAFVGCTNLSEVWVQCTTPPTLEDKLAFTNCGSEFKIYVPFGLGSTYVNATYWKTWHTHITEGILFDGAAYENATGMDNAKVRYTRTFNSGNWVPLFVPIGFDVSELGGDFQVAELSSVAYNAEGYDVMSWNIVTTVQANHPYIIRYTGTGSYELDHIFDSRTIASSETTAFTSTVCNNGGSDENARRYTLTGTYEEKVYGDGTEWYAMGGGNFWPATTGNSLPAQRFFLTITDPNKTPGQDGYYKSAPQGGTIIRVGEENVGIIRPEGTIMLPADDNYYDLLGRRVEQPQKGNIYIHNHKKIVY